MSSFKTSISFCRCAGNGTLSTSNLLMACSLCVFVFEKVGRRLELLAFVAIVLASRLALSLSLKMRLFSAESNKVGSWVFSV